jgi:SARP family transcriptional regulator, regulator of embCAB operon
MSPQTEIRVLGTLDIRYGDVPITPSAGKPRQVLCLLALRTGHPVSASLLMEEIWGDIPPRSAATTLQTYILQIRRLIACAAGEPKDVLRSCFGGYMLEDCWLDAAEFERLSISGTAAMDGGDVLTASRLLSEALGLWRGPALSGVPIGRVVEPELIWLDEARLRVLEQRIEADLRLGKNGSLVPELRRLVVQSPRGAVPNEREPGRPADACAGRFWPGRPGARCLPAAARGHGHRARHRPVGSPAAAAAGRTCRQRGTERQRVRLRSGGRRGSRQAVAAGLLAELRG